METYPWTLLRPKAQTTRLQGQTVSGPVSLSGLQPQARADGGGRWVTELADIILNTPEKVLAARAWSGHLAGGSASVVVPFYDHAQAPFPAWVTPRMDCQEDFFGQTLVYEGGPYIVAAVATAAALRATTVELTVAQSKHSSPTRRLRESGLGYIRETGGPLLNEDSGSALLGGEHFSIDHPVNGWRVYRVGRVLSVEGDVHAIEISPPLREAVTAGETAEFDVPRCVMTLAPGSAEAFEPTVERGFPTIRATFLEA